MNQGKDTTRPLDAASVLERVALARRLVALAAERLRQGTVDLDVVRTGLTELEAELARGVTS